MLDGTGCDGLSYKQIIEGALNQVPMNAVSNIGPCSDPSTVILMHNQMCWQLNSDLSLVPCMSADECIKSCQYCRTGGVVQPPSNCTYWTISNGGCADALSGSASVWLVGQCYTLDPCGTW